MIFLSCVTCTVCRQYFVYSQSTTCLTFVIFSSCICNLSFLCDRSPISACMISLTCLTPLFFVICLLCEQPSLWNWVSFILSDRNLFLKHFWNLYFLVLFQDPAVQLIVLKACVQFYPGASASFAVSLLNFATFNITYIVI